MAQNRELMRAVIMENIGGPRVLNYVRLARPVPAAGEVLVKIHATSINSCDLHYRRGRFVLRKPMPHILGADLAGEIVEPAADVVGWDIGERVFASFERLGRAIDGSYAEYCIVPADELVRMPDDLDYQSAAAAGASFADAFPGAGQQRKTEESRYGRHTRGGGSCRDGGCADRPRTRRQSHRHQRGRIRK